MQSAQLVGDGQHAVDRICAVAAVAAGPEYQTLGGELRMRGCWNAAGQQQHKAATLQRYDRKAMDAVGCASNCNAKQQVHA